MSEQEEFRLWMRKIKDFDAGWLGFLVVVVTLIATAVGGWYGISLFISGTYPKIVIAAPGLISGFIAFLIAAKIAFKFRRQ